MNSPEIKKSITENVVPFPLLNKDPIKIKKKIKLEDKILKCIPIIEPNIKKKIINKVLPSPIPKCEPTNAMYMEENKIDKLVDIELSKNLDLIR